MRRKNQPAFNQNFLRLSALSLLASFISMSCGILPFTVSQDLETQHITGSALGGLLPNFFNAPIPLHIDIQTEVAKRDTGGIVNKAYLDALSIAIAPTANSAANFDFLDSIQIYIETSNGSGAQKVAIASIGQVTKGQSRLDFKIIPNVDLLPYIQAGAVLTASATGRQPSQDVYFNGRVTLKIYI